MFANSVHKFYNICEYFIMSKQNQKITIFRSADTAYFGSIIEIQLWAPQMVCIIWIVQIRRSTRWVKQLSCVGRRVMLREPTKHYELSSSYYRNGIGLTEKKSNNLLKMWIQLYAWSCMVQIFLYYFHFQSLILVQHHWS